MSRTSYKHLMYVQFWLCEHLIKVSKGQVASSFSSLLQSILRSPRSLDVQVCKSEIEGKAHPKLNSLLSSERRGAFLCTDLWQGIIKIHCNIY